MVFLKDNTIKILLTGLVFFREGPDNGYGLICGSGGNFNPVRGNLEGFCEAVSCD